DRHDGEAPRYFKDGINDYVVDGAKEAINPRQVGTKAAAHYTFEIPARGHQTLRLRLSSASIEHDDGALVRRFSRVLETRKREADDFYAQVIPGSLSADRRAVVRQSLAGMLWSKQFYDYDVDAWLTAHGGAPSQGTNGGGHRNAEWAHMVNADVISMPDKWEYPWYAAWDLAFHAVPLALVDPAYAKKQLLLLLKESYLRPNGQVPAYEWNFGDVNPPVHAWCAYFLYQLDKQRSGRGDLEFLKTIYNKLLLNFTWWVNRKDQQGRNVFEGGFLGLDNVGVFDCSTPLPKGGHLEQTDGTAWMAFYAQAMLQISLLLKEPYLHPNGQVPAYEWNFGDVNPPVHAWCAYFLYQLDKRRSGHGDLDFLKSIYNKLLLNFTWWVNRKDQQGRNVFEGGFLGLDNVGVFDCSTPLPKGGHLEQTDGTAWMAFYAQAMLQISLELAIEDRSYVDMALKFFDHFVWIASSMIQIGGQGEMWNEEDGFFYDVLRTPDGKARQLKVRSIVGLLPLCTAAAIDEQVVAALPELQQRARWFANHRPHLVSNIHDPRRPGYRDRRLLSLLSEERLRRVLGHVLDENEFLSPFGIRSLSRYHLEHPYTLNLDGQEIKVGYLPAESDSGLFGGNSNWRGPIWMPVNALFIKALINYHAYYGPSFRVEYPTGSGHRASLYEVAKGLTERLARIFLRDKSGRRPVFGSTPKLSDDPLWRDHLLFYEYFHGDNGAGIGASHQTGWTGLIASLLHYFATVSASEALNLWSPDAPRAA
ncbi:MAG TPA: hypothetical protein VLA79_14070, partial [Polyangia bacterium]|nr:hypothetical protein [Polyangia bacterium]